MAPERETEESAKQERELERTSERFGREADEMERRSAALGQEIDETRQDWERKRADERVPGANPPPSSEEEPPEEASFPAKEGEDPSDA